MERWNGRVAVVTGASGGIGAAIARALAQQGMTVVGVDRKEEELKEMATELNGLAGRLIPYKCDLMVESEISGAYEWIRQTLGGADVVVNCAGVTDNTPLLEASTEKWREMININVLAVAVSSKLAMTSMLDRGIDDGHVININSLLGHKVMGNLMPFYSATKWAVTALCQAFQNEMCVRQSHIRITSVCPGLTKTSMVEHFEEGKDDVALDPSDVAHAVVYALSTPPHVLIEEIKIAPNQGSVGHSLAPVRVNK